MFHCCCFNVGQKSFFLQWAAVYVEIHNQIKYSSKGLLGTQPLNGTSTSTPQGLGTWRKEGDTMPEEENVEESCEMLSPGQEVAILLMTSWQL